MAIESSIPVPDGLAVPRALAPTSPEELAGILRNANDEHLAIVPIGGGTMLDLGAPLKRADLLLSLGKLDRVIDYQPANLTVRAEAGLTLGALNARLAAEGQCLPLDPPCPERATLGGILATNTSGALRLRYGSARDLLIGIQVALADGQIVRGGGQVVKNVAGYDLPKLFVGSLGTLGVIVEATFKVVPLPNQTATVIAGFQDVAQACAVANRVSTSPLSPLGCIILDSRVAAPVDTADPWVIAVRFGGIASAVTRQCEDTTRLAQEGGSGAVVTTAEDSSLWARVRDFVTEHPIVLKITVLPTQIAEMERATIEVAARYPISSSSIAHSIGILYVALDGSQAPLVDAISELGEVAAALRGHCIVQRAPRHIRESVQVWGPPRSDWSVMQKIKQEFDPNGTLNPGRFVGGI